jgi:hypothetical protein
MTDQSRGVPVCDNVRHRRPGVPHHAQVDYFRVGLTLRYRDVSLSFEYRISRLPAAWLSPSKRRVVFLSCSQQFSFVRPHGISMSPSRQSPQLRRPHSSFLGPCHPGVWYGAPSARSNAVPNAVPPPISWQLEARGFRSLEPVGVAPMSRLAPARNRATRSLTRARRWESWDEFQTEGRPWLVSWGERFLSYGASVAILDSIEESGLADRFQYSWGGWWSLALRWQGRREHSGAVQEIQ